MLLLRARGNLGLHALQEGNAGAVRAAKLRLGLRALLDPRDESASREAAIAGARSSRLAGGYSLPRLSSPRSP